MSDSNAEIKSDPIKRHNTKEILQESLDTIQATFWIKGDEFTYATAEYVGLENFQSTYDWTPWDNVEKFIPARVDFDVSDTNVSSNCQVKDDLAKVTGVCSIGALALANVTLYDEPLTQYDSMASRDIYTFLAGAALSMAICELEDDWSYLTNYDEYSEAIANWNDGLSDYDGRDLVIKAFQGALKQPLAGDEVEPFVLYVATPWRINNGHGPDSTRLMFATQKEAEAFLAAKPTEEAYEGDEAMDARWFLMYETYGSDAEYTVAPLDHPAMLRV